MWGCNCHSPDHPVKYILTYKLSQDHLETFFSCVRHAGRFNNNPNARQFEAIFRRLLFRSGVSLSPHDNTNVHLQDDTSLIPIQCEKDRSEFRSLRLRFWLEPQTLGLGLETCWTRTRVLPSKTRTRLGTCWTRTRENVTAHWHKDGYVVPDRYE